MLKEIHRSVPRYHRGIGKVDIPFIIMYINHVSDHYYGH
jgi:hypothetical protein